MPLNASEARRTLKGNAKELEVGVEAVAKRQKKEKERAAKAISGTRAPKGKKKVLKEKTYVNGKGRTGSFSLYEFPICGEFC